MIEFELLLIQPVNCFHIFHALLEDLHFLLQFDFLLGLVISIFGSQVLKLLSIILFVFSSLTLEVLLHLSVLTKETFDLVLILFKDLASFIVECFLNVVELVDVVFSHVFELLPHGLNQLVHIIILPLEGLDVLLVFDLELL
jgi:hypothetical protein